MQYTNASMYLPTHESRGKLLVYSLKCNIPEKEMNNCPSNIKSLPSHTCMID